MKEITDSIQRTYKNAHACEIMHVWAEPHDRYLAVVKVTHFDHDFDEIEPPVRVETLKFLRFYRGLDGHRHMSIDKEIELTKGVQ